MRTVRETEFRGFHPCDGPETIVVNGEKVKGRWAQGYFFQIWERTYILWGTTNDVPNMIEVLPSTVGQYTGLTDKNGKRIFEGDIVRRETDYYGKHNIYDEPVAWEDDIENDSFGEPYTSGYCIHGGNWEIIGTVYDPEVTGAAAE